MKWFVKCIQNYVNFKGRARRSEYWYFTLFVLIITLVLRVVDNALFGADRSGVLLSLFGLFIFLPQASVMVRRLHDTGRSGVWVLWYYILGIIWAAFMIVFTLPDLEVAIQSGAEVAFSTPMLFFIGIGSLVFFVWALLFIVWFCKNGDQGENKYGPDPKAQ